MKHSDLKFWFLDDNIDGYTTDREYSGQNQCAPEFIGRDQVDLTPEKRKNQADEICFKLPSNLQEIDDVLLNKSQSRKTYEETVMNSTLTKAFFDNNNVEEFRNQQQQCLKSAEKQVNVNSPYVLNKRNSNNVAKKTCKNSGTPKSALLSKSKQGLVVSPKVSTCKSPKNINKNIKTSNLNKKMKKSTTRVSQTKLTAVETSFENSSVQNSKVFMEMSPKIKEKVQKSKNISSKSIRVETSKNFEANKLYQKNYEQKDAFCSEEYEHKQKNYINNSGGKNLYYQGQINHSSKIKSSINLKSSRNSIYSANNVNSQKPNAIQNCCPNCHDSIKTGKTQSTNMNSYYSDISSEKMNVKSHVKDFYMKIVSITDNNINNLSKSLNKNELRNLIYTNFEDLIFTIDEFQLDEQIGKGSTSNVYKGCFRYTDVAFKKVNVALYTPKQLIYLFNELICMKKLRHPNIVLLLGISIDDNENLFIMLEYCEQKSLNQFVNLYKNVIPELTKFEILFDVAKALTYFHNNSPKVIHRDMKPENIFITGDVKAKVGDFGMCLLLDSDQQIQDTANDYYKGFHATETEGTLQYMAPETLKKSTYSTCSDIYAFGIILWEFLQEKEAYDGLENFFLIDGVANKNLRPTIDHKIEQLGPNVVSMLKECWDTDPYKRPNAKDLCSKIKNIINELSQTQSK